MHETGQAGRATAPIASVICPPSYRNQVFMTFLLVVGNIIGTVCGRMQS
ncbi:hypothetical protein [Komagataeibacter medellinensis]|nr:hypothetical protein [Komagataeibacter medellinensis]